MAKTFSYSKKEKLKSRKQLEALFATGSSFLLFPFKVMYMLPAAPMETVIKTGVGAGSRHFKKAVQRNRIKRLLREAYRLNKLPLHRFLQENNRQLIIFILYIDKLMPQAGMIQRKMPLVIEKLTHHLTKMFRDMTTENKDAFNVEK